jgi:hypothetical protein
MTMPDGTSPPPPGPPSYPPTAPGQPYVPAGPTGYAQPPMAPPKRNRRSGLVALGVLVVLIILIVGGLALFRDRISGDVNALAVGDCIDEPSSTISISEVQHQPCAELHDGEVFAVLTYPGGNDAVYPGTSAFSDYVREQCLPAVQAYTGRTLDEIAGAGLTYAYFYPTTSSWDDNDDRGVTCYLEKDDGTKTTGSFRAAAPSSP